MPTLRYKVVERESPVTHQKVFYAVRESYAIERIKTDDLIDSISENSQLPRAIVPAALAAILKSITNFVLNGHSVTVPRLGTFTGTITSRAAESREAFTASNIKGMRVRFRKSPELDQASRYSVRFVRSTFDGADAGADEEGGL